MSKANAAQVLALRATRATIDAIRRQRAEGEASSDAAEGCMELARQVYSPK